MNRLLLTILALIFFAPAVATEGGSESPFAFGAGARDLAMGGAGRAVTDGSTAPFWNPSRLAPLERYAISGFYSNLYGNETSYQYLGLALPTMDLGTFGLGVFRLGVGGIEKTDAANLSLGQFSDNRLAFYFAYGRRLSAFEVGGALVFEYQSIDEYNATSSPGLNLSVSRTFMLGNGRFRSLSAALVGSNLIRPKLKLVEESVADPYTIDLAATLNIAIWQKRGHYLSVSAGINKVDYIDARFNAGFEYNLEDILLVRAGDRNGDLSLGAGVKYQNFALDYALVDRDMGSLHLFTLTTEFGTPVSERRRLREEAKERQFTALMNDRLRTSNLKMAEQLTAQGRQLLKSEKFYEALNNFDRALFLARSMSADTSEIMALVAEASNKIAAIEAEAQYTLCVDSARYNLENGDYLAARHFAGMGLAERPQSEECRRLLDDANLAIEQMTSRDETITDQLRTTDSLLNYGMVEEAYTAAQILAEFAPENQLVQETLKRARFEKWREAASRDYARLNYQAALRAVDSALAIYSGHQWCLELKHRIKKNIELQNAGAASTPAPGAGKSDAAIKLTPEIRREVNTIYEKARELFTAGNLNEAIVNWEKVERMAPDYLSVRDYLVKAYKFVGVELYGQNKFSEAVAIWQKAASLDPENEEINSYIRRTETEMRKMQEMSYEQAR